MKERLAQRSDTRRSEKSFRSTSARSSIASPWWESKSVGATSATASRASALGLHRAPAPREDLGLDAAPDHLGHDDLRPRRRRLPSGRAARPPRAAPGRYTACASIASVVASSPPVAHRRRASRRPRAAGSRPAPGRPSSILTSASWCETQPMLPSWSRVSLASPKSSSASSNSPCMACSDASGLTIERPRPPDSRRRGRGTPGSAGSRRRPEWVRARLRSRACRGSGTARGRRPLCARRPRPRPTALSASPDAPGDPHGLGPQVPGPALPGVVTLALEHRERLVGRRRACAVADARLGLEAHELALDSRAGLEPRPGRARDRLVEDGHGLGDAARLEERCPERGQQRAARRVIGSDQRGRALEQRARGRRIVTLGRAQAGGAQVRRRPRGERRGGLVGLAELAAQPHGALDVVAEQLVDDHREGRRAAPPASPRSARAARRAAPSACLRRRRRGSAGGGSGTSPHPRPMGRIRSLRTSARRRAPMESPGRRRPPAPPRARA